MNELKKDQDWTPYNLELVASIHLDLSNTLLELNDFDNALKHAEIGENLIRGLAQDQQTKEKIVPMYLTKGKCLMHVGDLFNAIGVLKEALDVNKDTLETKDFLNNWKMEKATFEAYLAVCYMSSGQLLKAYKQVETALDDLDEVKKVEGHFKCKLLTTLFYCRNI